jgi:hypothetical protein
MSRMFDGLGNDEVGWKLRVLARRNERLLLGQSFENKAKALVIVEACRSGTSSFSQEVF